MTYTVLKAPLNVFIITESYRRLR